MHRRQKSLLVSFLAIGALFFAGAVVLHSSTFHEYLLSLLQRGTGWKISIANSKIRILGGRVEIQGLEAKDPQDHFRMSADHLHLQLSPLSLIRGKLIISELGIDHPILNVEKSESQVKTPPEEIVRKIFAGLEKSWFLSNTILDHIDLHHLTINRTGQEPLVLEKTILHLEPNLLREIEIGASLEEASGLISSLRKIQFVVALKKDGIKLKELMLDSETIKLSLKGVWQGDLESGSLRLEGGMEAPRILSDPIQFLVEGQLSKKIMNLKRIEAHLAKAILEGKGNLNTTNLQYDLFFTAKEVSLESIFQKLNGVVLAPAKGIGEVKGRAFGQLPHLVIKSEAVIRDFRHGPMAAQKAEGTVNLDWPNLDFDASIQPGSSVRNSAGNNERPEGHVKGGITFKHLPDMEKLQVVTRFVDLTFENASLEELLPTSKMMGKLDGILHLAGAQGTSVQGTAHAKVSGGHWVFGPVDSLVTDVDFQPSGKIIFTKTEMEIPNLSILEWPGSIELSPAGTELLFTGEPVPGISFKGDYQYASEEFHIESLHIRREEGALEGAFNFLPGGKGDAKLKGTANLEWLRLFPSAFRETSGMAHLDLTATGSLQEPVIRGQIEFLGDEIGIRAFSEGISDLKGVLRIDGASLNPKLTGHLGDGTFHLEGRLQYAHGKPEEFDLTFKGTNLTLSKANLYRIDLDTNLSFKGKFPAPRLEGRIDIVDGLYLKPFVIRELVLKPFEQPSEPSAWEKSVETMQLRLEVKNSGDLKIQNNVATILLRSDLQIGGTYGHPKMTGALTATEGFFHYLGEDFILNEGRLEFVDPSKEEPYLTLVAQREIPPQYLVLIEVKGILSNLDVTLASSPSLPREDILSLITFGMTQEEVRQSGRGKRSISSSLLAEEISGSLGRPLSKTTRLDILRLEASETGTLSRLSVGKNVTDRLSLEFTSDLAPETAERTMQANYYLTDNILLKGFQTRTAATTNPRYQFNVSFRFRLH